MKNLFLTFCFLFSGLFYSQIIFEPGTIITKNGEKMEVLIKNYDWKNSPTEIEYKTDNSNNIKKISSSEIQEFSVGNLNYITANVLVDYSSSNINNLSRSENFDNKAETLLLKNIVNGKVSLYRYSDTKINKFFYKKENDETYYPLSFKEYLFQEKYINKNEYYKIQLKKEFADNAAITDKDLNRIFYSENDLKKIFMKYNNIENDLAAENKKDFHIYLKPGAGISYYKILPPEDDKSVGEYKKNGISYRFGIELEYVFNFNKGKWALISEPAFQSTNIKLNYYNRRNFEAKYSTIQIPLGIKYNFFLNQKSKFFVKASIYADIPVNKDVILIDGYAIERGASFGMQIISAGYNYDKFGAEIKFGSTANFTSSYYGQYNSLGFDGFSLSLSYKLF